ncbi:MAG: hypothetical protein JSV83_17690, partial [Desulfobacterales bacterium]
HTYINLTPDAVDNDATINTNKQERVEVQALVSGTNKGLAGVIFSPSYIGGDSYILHARMAHSPYERTLGGLDRNPWFEKKTGSITVWRVMHIHKSLNMPEAGTVGLRPGVGSAAEQRLRDRVHLGDGRNMEMSVINDHYQHSFSEWTIPSPVAITAVASGNPVTVTAPGHGLATGDCVRIEGVTGINSANGTFVVKQNSDDEFEIHSAYDFTDANGLGPTVNGGGTHTPPTISGATNAAPIEITTAANHHLNTGDIVEIRDVQGNLAANGIFKVTKTANKKFTLNDSDGTSSDKYTNGGRVYTGFIDVHRGINLKQYRDTYMAVAGLGDGKIPMTGPDRIQMEFAPFDHYRWRLPPGPKDGSDAQYMSRVIRKMAGAGSVPWGTTSRTALATVRDAIVNGTYPGAAVVAIPSYAGTEAAYMTEVNNKANSIRNRLLVVFAVSVPSGNRPQSMVVLRWPRLYHHGIWNKAETTAANIRFDWGGGYTEGVCFSNGKSIFETASLSTVFPHEMGHSCHLSHFVVGGHDFNWKHHDLHSQNCIMSYDFPEGFIPISAWPAPVSIQGEGPAGAASRATGWPDFEPAAWPDGSSHRNGAVNIARWTIAFGPEPNLTRLCAKCAMKLRGWDEEMLPCAWDHPDLF